MQPKMGEYASKIHRKGLKKRLNRTNNNLLIGYQNYIYCASINAEKFEIFRENLFGVRTHVVHSSSEFASKIKEIVIMYL